MSLLAAFMATLNGDVSIAYDASMQQASPFQLPAAFEQQAGTTDFTFEFWTKMDGVNGQLFVTSPDSGDSRFMAHMPLNGNFYFASGYIGDGSGQTPPIPPPHWFTNYDAIHHFAWVVQLPQPGFNGAMNVYLDGELLYYYYISVRRNPMGVPLLFPMQQGTAGEVRYWNRARTQDEIRYLMNRSVVGPRTGLVGAWRCNERGPAGTQVRDRSGNNLHGLIY